jgi:hypothetical protein
MKKKGKFTKLLDPLFKTAQNKDEFEFCSTIMRIRGLESPGWDPLTESFALIDQFLSFVNAPIDSTLRLRILLFLYCHITEIDDIYNVLANLGRVCLGERYSFDPFLPALHQSGKTVKNISLKTMRIGEWLEKSGFQEINENLQKIIVKQIRNAFYHSDYVIHENNFNIRKGEGVVIDNVLTTSIPIDWIIPIINNAINFSMALINLIFFYIASYKKEKIVPARILDNDEIELLMLTVEKNQGLSGFRSLTDSEKKHLGS